MTSSRQEYSYISALSLLFIFRRYSLAVSMIGGFLNILDISSRVIFTPSFSVNIFLTSIIRYFSAFFNDFEAFFYLIYIYVVVLSDYVW